MGLSGQVFDSPFYVISEFRCTTVTVSFVKGMSRTLFIYLLCQCELLNYSYLNGVVLLGGVYKFVNFIFSSLFIRKTSPLVLV